MRFSVAVFFLLQKFFIYFFQTKRKTQLNYVRAAHLIYIEPNQIVVAAAAAGAVSLKNSQRIDCKKEIQLQLRLSSENVQFSKKKKLFSECCVVMVAIDGIVAVMDLNFSSI